MEVYNNLFNTSWLLFVYCQRVCCLVTIVLQLTIFKVKRLGKGCYGKRCLGICSKIRLIYHTYEILKCDGLRQTDEACNMHTGKKLAKNRAC